MVKRVHWGGVAGDPAALLRQRLPPVSAQNNTVSSAAPDLNSPAAANMSKAVWTSRSRKPKWYR